MTQDGPRPPVTGPGHPTATPPCTSSPHLCGHAVSPAPDPGFAAAVMEMLRQQQERDREQREHDREQRGHDRELGEDKRETARARERAEDLEHKERDREQRDHARQLDSERAAELDRERQLDRERAGEHDRLVIEAQPETGARLEQLHRDMANSPRFSRRGTPTGTPVPAVDDRPKPAPHKTPTKACHTVPYQEADRHPGSAETTPSPRHVPVHTEFSRARTSTVDPPNPHTAARRGLADSFRPLGPPPHPPREVAPPRSSPPPVARITTHPTSQCRPPKPDPSPVTNNDQLQAMVAAFTTALAQTQHTAAGQPAAASECIPAPRHEPHTVPVRYDPPPAHDECPEPVHAYSLGRVHDDRYSPYQQPPPHPPTNTCSLQ